MKRTRTLLVTGILVAAAAAAVAPDSGIGADAPKDVAPRSGLYVFRWLELRTDADGLDLRAAHFGADVRGLLADSGAKDRFGTLELADPEVAIAHLRKLGDLEVLERARIVIMEPRGAGEYVSGAKLPIESREARGDETYVRTVFEQIGAHVALQRLNHDEIRYELKLAAPTALARTRMPIISNRAWEASAVLPSGHTLVLTSQVRHDPWIGTPFDAEAADSKADGAAKTRKTDTRIWIVLITRTALR